MEGGWQARIHRSVWNGVEPLASDALENGMPSPQYLHNCLVKAGKQRNRRKKKRKKRRNGVTTVPVCCNGVTNRYMQSSRPRDSSHIPSCHRNRGGKATAADHGISCTGAIRDKGA